MAPKIGAVERRAVPFARENIDQEARTATLAFSSEEPYDRSWGREILDHQPESIRLGRLTAGGPLLVDHDTRDHIGVIEDVQIGDDLVGRAVVRFGRSARASEIYNDVIDGIRRSVSVGYVIHRADLSGKAEGLDVYRVSDWEPFEISLVSVPADPTVGVGRSADPASQSPEIGQETKIMETTENAAPAAEAPRVEIDVAGIEKRAADAAHKRASEILALGQQYQAAELAADYVQNGGSLEQFKTALLERQANNPLNSSDVGMSRAEVKEFSFLRAINALANPGDRKAQEAAGFERECSEAVGAKLGRSAQGFYIPSDVLRRDLTAGTANAGGDTVSTDLLAQDFISLLRNRMMVMQMGAQMMTGLSGNVAIPRATGGATAYWVAESGAPTESQQAFDQVTMSPTTVGAFTDISRRLILQSSIDVEAFVRSDLATVLAIAIDAAAINGSGASNQPTGILNVSGIGDVAGGTNGAAPSWANIVELETDVSVANADIGSLGYLTNAKVRGKLKGTETFSGSNGVAVWAGGDTPLNGYRAGVSNQVPSNLTKGTASGVCSAIIFGNWSDLMIGQWGSLDLMVDPYSGSTSGTVRVVALQDVDVAVRHATSFSAMLDALTA